MNRSSKLISLASHRIGSGSFRVLAHPVTFLTTSLRYNSTEGDSFRLKEFSDKYLHGRKVNFTEKLEIIDSKQLATFPIYRVTDTSGAVVNGAQPPEFSKEYALKIYHEMVKIGELDKVLYDSQRQGRISFYMTNSGEEASHIGSAAAIKDDDLIYSQYREVGVLLWRGYPIEGIMNQCFGNKMDTGCGKQMPVHYGSAEHHYVTVSSPLTTQLPQAVGSAYAYKMMKNNRITVVYFGEGAASEGDAHAAFNFAKTLQCPIIFFCRNNGYAISTPVHEQYGGDGIAGRAVGYGISTIRVDGNDVLAVYNATKAARESASQNKPVLIEAMNYRIGHHSTSDDFIAYRSESEVKMWHDQDDPVKRFRLYLEQKKWWSNVEDADCRKRLRKDILSALSASEKVLKPNPKKMFDGVYKEIPKNLIEQRDRLNEHLKSFGKFYPMKNFEGLTPK